MGRPHGWLEIPSHHIRLDQRTIEAALTTDLATGPYETTPLALLPASLADDHMVSVEAALIIAGHEVLDRGLLLTYGLDVLVGISAQLYADGPRAHILLEETLSPAIREAALDAVQQTLRDFANSPPSQLQASGWTRPGEGRWQLLLRQA